MAAESPLKRRKRNNSIILVHSGFQSSSLSASSVPPVEDVPFSEARSFDSIYNSMCGHSTGVIMMVAWQDGVFASQWNGKPNGKFEFHGYGLGPNHIWARVTAYDGLASCLHSLLSFITAGFGFVEYSALSFAKTFRKEHDGAFCFQNCTRLPHEISDFLSFAEGDAQSNLL